MSKGGDFAGGTVSLPKGGGALQGIGESFSPDLHTGTANLRLPIGLPAGRNGLQPELSLLYSSGQGNSPFGLGWSLSLPGVSRKTSKGVPRYDDARDVFLLSGAEDLVPVAGGPQDPSGAQRYRPRTEGLFARIVHVRDAATDHWEVRSGDGRTSFYGTPGSAGTDPAVIAHPADRSRVFAWQLTRTNDPFGNRIEYVWERDAIQVDGPHVWDQLYLAEIRYADHGDPADPQFLVRVRFEYETRPDPGSEYRAGFEIRTMRRCSAIRVETLPQGVPVPVRTYHLTYLDQLGGPPESLPRNGASLLAAFQVEGQDGAASQWLPPVELDYSRFTPEERDFFPLTGPDLPPRSLAAPDQTLVPLFGNGLPDVVQLNGVARYWRNRGNGRFDPPREMRTAPAGISLSDPGVQIVDADGDGRADLLVTTGTQAGYFPLRHGALWDERSFQPYAVAPSFDLRDPEVHLVDLDGDGVTDAIRSATRLECYFNRPREGWGETRRVERRAVEEFPNVQFSDPRVRWADMTGDGLQDVVLVHDGNVEYWPNLGRGDWGRRVSMHGSPRFPEGYDPQRILLGDVDGDGAADLIYVDDGRVTLWINRGGNGWSAPLEIAGTPPVTDADAVRLADVLGTGVPGVLWSRDAAVDSRDNLFFLDFTGGVKPYLLTGIDNRMGAVTRLAYAPSTRFYLEDEARLETRWRTPLPFPVHVLARVEVLDAVSGNQVTSEYRYHHGYWDGAEREFRGFARVDRLDAEASPQQALAPPVETRTWFHPGPVEPLGEEDEGWVEADFSGETWAGDPAVLERPAAVASFLAGLPRAARRDALRALRGRILRTELYARDGSAREGRPYTVTEAALGVCEVISEAGRPKLAWTAGSPVSGGAPRVFLPYEAAHRTTEWERGEEPRTQVEIEGDLDRYGRPRSQITIAVPRGRDFRAELAASDPAPEPYLATRAVTEYAEADRADLYRLDLPARLTTWALPNDGRPSLFQVWAQAESGAFDLPANVLGQTRTYYDGDAFEGLPLGEVGPYGATVRHERLVLTPEILHAAWRSGTAVADPPEEPPYLALGGAPPWSAEYPQGFRDLLPPLAGYVFHPAGPGPAGVAGYFAAPERLGYDFQQPGAGTRGLILARRDPLGRDTLFAPDAFGLMPAAVTDPAGLTEQIAYDDRLLQPAQTVDANGNRTVYAFTPLGWLASIARLGKEGEAVGDTPAEPGTRYEYDLGFGLDPQPRPISVRTIRRVHHAHDLDVPLPERGETVETVEYSDGFGRLVQVRSQGDERVFGDPVWGGAVLPLDPDLAPGDAVGLDAPAGTPRVLVSGWQVYDNKGRVVERYEPYFAAGWDYEPPQAAQLGRKLTTFYDPRGQEIRAVHPDGSERRVVHGVPLDLADPDAFVPTPWETFSYDANDNAGRTHGATAAGLAHHWDTPASLELDALGRIRKAVQRNRGPAAPGGPLPPVEELQVLSTYNLRGDLIDVTDALGRLAFRHVYDLTGRMLRAESLDAGVRRSVLDAAGNVLERRDSRGALTLHAVDSAGRPVKVWARDGAGEALTLREQVIYGDDPAAGLTLAQAAAANLLGRPWQRYDEAGLLTATSYDFRGHLVDRERRVIRDEALLAGFSPPPAGWQVAAFRTDWQPPAGTALAQHAAGLLDSVSHAVSTVYDALGRVRLLDYPEDAEGERKRLRPSYHPSGLLESLELDGETLVERVAYNAQGKRSLIAYGNGVMTRHAYDPDTFRLARLRSEPFTVLGNAYQPSGPALQDAGLAHDLMGNVAAVRERFPGCGIPNTLAGLDALDRSFAYDALYRLIRATGRECAAPPPAAPWDDGPKCHDATQTRAYSEEYAYDAAGNLAQLHHQAGAGGSYTRFLSLGTGNLLAAVATGQSTFSYAYDAAGNLVSETAARHFEWDHAGRLRAFRTQTAGAEPSIHAQYLYDPAGQRVKKLVRLQGGAYEVTVYVEGLFERRRIVQAGNPQSNDLLHALDDRSRVATLRVGPAMPGDTGPAMQWILGDFLGSGSLVLDGTGAWVRREEYSPYGETTFGGFARKRYRFTGQERDEESGLSCHGARYYAPWLARWVSCDPAGMADGLNLTAYVHDNPLRLVDREGTNGTTPAPAAGVTPPPPPPPAAPATTGAATAGTGATSPVMPAPITVYRQRGLRAAQELKDRFDAKGVETQMEVTVKGGRGGSRVDLAPVPTAQKTIARTIESKSMDLDHYRDPSGNLDQTAVRNNVDRHIQQVQKHQDHLKAGVKPDLPSKEGIVYTVENGTKAEAAQVRTIARTQATPQGIKVGVVQPPPARPPMMVRAGSLAGSALGALGMIGMVKDLVDLARGKDKGFIEGAPGHPFIYDLGKYLKYHGIDVGEGKDGTTFDIGNESFIIIDGRVSPYT